MSDERYLLANVRQRKPVEIKLERDQAERLYDILWWIAGWLALIAINLTCGTSRIVVKT